VVGLQRRRKPFVSRAGLMGLYEAAFAPTGPWWPKVRGTAVTRPPGALSETACRHPEGRLAELGGVVPTRQRKNDTLATDELRFRDNDTTLGAW